MFRCDNHSQVLSFRRDDPYTPWTRDIEIPALIHLHSIACVFSRRACHIKEDLAVAQGSVRINFIAHYNLLLAPVINVEVLLVRGEGQTVWTVEVFCYKLDIPVRNPENPAEWQLLSRIIKHFWQPKWRIGEIKRAIGLVDQVVRTVQTFALIAICHHGEISVFFDAHNTTVSVLIDGESPLIVQCQAVRSRLGVLTDVHACIPTLGHVN